MVGAGRAQSTMLIGVVTLACALSTTAASQTPSSPAARGSSASGWTVPRTAWGHPDLQGVWTTDAEVSVPLERPKAFGDRAMLTDAELADRAKLEEKLSRDDPNNRDTFRLGPVGDGPEHWFEWGRKPSARTSLIIDPPDGRIPPLTPAAQARVVDPRRIVGYGERAGSQLGGPFNGPEDLSLADRCITRGLPSTWFPQVYNNGFQIVQNPGHVAIYYERLHEARVVPLDGRAHLTPDLRQWMGDSRGHFEGDTLVVDVTNFSDRTSFRRSGATLHLVERYTRLDRDTVRVEITIEDDTTWTRPWTVAVTGKRDASYSMIYEYACHEGNYSVANILSGARAEEQRPSSPPQTASPPQR
jgi:hypothetical protein